MTTKRKPDEDIRAPYPPWPVEDVALLRRLWGQTTSPQIAKQLGKTKSAVIAKAGRLGLTMTAEQYTRSRQMAQAPRVQVAMARKLAAARSIKAGGSAPIPVKPAKHAHRPGSIKFHPSQPPKLVIDPNDNASLIAARLLENAHAAERRRETYREFKIVAR